MSTPLLSFLGVLVNFGLVGHGRSRSRGPDSDAHGLSRCSRCQQELRYRGAANADKTCPRCLRYGVSPAIQASARDGTLETGRHMTMVQVLRRPAGAR
jgi:hypothetical protein